MLCIHSLIYFSQSPWGGITRIPVNPSKEMRTGWEAQGVQQPPSAWWPLSYFLSEKNPKKAASSWRHTGPWLEWGGWSRRSVCPSSCRLRPVSALGELMVGHLFIFFLFTFLKIKVELIYNVMATFLNRGFKYRSAFLRGKVLRRGWWWQRSPHESPGQQVAIILIRSAATLRQMECPPWARHCSKHLMFVLINLGGVCVLFSGPFCWWGPGRWGNSPEWTHLGLRPSHGLNYKA